MTRTNDEVKEKIKEILHARMMAKSDYDTCESRLENTTKSLVTLYTEMVEGELENYNKFLVKKRGKSQYYAETVVTTGSNDLQDLLDEFVKQYLLEKKGNL